MCKEKDGKLKFSALEMMSSGNTGQTSATGVIGVFLCSVPMIGMLALLVFYFVNPSEAANILELMDRGIALVGIGAAVLGTRKISGMIGNSQRAKLVLNTLEENVGSYERE